MKTDREKLMELTSKAEEQYYNETPVGKISFKTHRAYVADYLISKGVTIPVRCGKCKHYDNPFCSQNRRIYSQDGFCSYGERKEDGQKA